MATQKERVAKYRKRMTETGMRPIQIWVPDTRKPTFAEECRKQSMMLVGDGQEREILAFIEDLTDTGDWR